MVYMRKHPPLCVAIASVTALFSITGQQAAAQGCVAARCPVNLSPGEMILHGEGEESTGWQATIGYRWLRSARHFTGTHEDTERREEGSQVVNNSHFVDVALTYEVTPRFSATLTMPFVNHDRSSVVRNLSREIIERYHVQSHGLGDIRLGGNYWVFDPMSRPKGNVLVSLGVDLPTGDDDVEDIHRRFNPATGLVEDVVRTVDQSIQPGDGGWGIPIDLYAYYSFNDRLAGYLSGSYSITPEEQNGVLTGRGNPYESEMSVADTFAARLGMEYVLSPKNGISVSLGLRAEGVPVYDLVGGSDGFRRPGIAVSTEPGISWMKNGWSASVTVPIAIYRERFQSVPDKQLEAATGVPRHGDAAFADYLVMVTVGRHF